MKSIFTPLKNEGLTTLKIRYDWRTDRVTLYAAKEWEKDTDFSNYNKTFYVGGVITDDTKYLNTNQVREIFKKYDLEDYLDQVIDLVKQGKHYGMTCFYNDKYNIRFMCNIHSPLLGINNRRYATLAGGIRRHGFEDDEIDVIIDGLNLGRGMTFKNIAAGLDFGGCKTTVHMDPLQLDNLDMMGFLAYSIDCIGTMTGPDMNFPTEMADVMNENFSIQYTSGPKSPLGETGKPTAYGTYLALKQAVKFKKGTESLDGLKIAVQGLGCVGWYMATNLLKEDVKLVVTDVNEARTKELMAQYPEKSIEYVPVTEILDIEADVLCPSAIGGIFHDGNIPNLKFDIIIGAANNQTKASSQEEEIRLAKIMADRGILFQEAWWHNTAGVMCGAEEYINGKNATLDNLYKKIDETVPRKTWDNLNRAKELGITPTECMYKTCEEIVYKK